MQKLEELKRQVEVQQQTLAHEITVLGDAQQKTFSREITSLFDSFLRVPENPPLGDKVEAQQETLTRDEVIGDAWLRPPSNPFPGGKVCREESADGSRSRRLHHGHKSPVLTRD